MLKISIIVPCYNQAQYLDEALQSVLDQTYTNWECIIVNDGSPDNTKQIAQKWVEKDSRFKYIYKENGGLSSARNEGITIAEGEFILPLDADDKIGANYLSLAIDVFQKDSEVKVVYCQAEKFGEEKGLWILPDFSLYQLSRENMIFCSAFFRKKDWEIVGGYDINMIYGNEDWEFWISLLKNEDEKAVKRLAKVCFYYRVKKISMLKQINEFALKEIYEYLSIKHSDFFVKQFGTFFYLSNLINSNKAQILINSRSKKFVIDLFCKTFFGFTIFGTLKIN